MEKKVLNAVTRSPADADLFSVQASIQVRWASYQSDMTNDMQVPLL